MPDNGFVKVLNIYQNPFSCVERTTLAGESFLLSARPRIPVFCAATNCSRRSKITSFDFHKH